MRPYGRPVAEFPGTVARCSKTICQKCHRNGHGTPKVYAKPRERSGRGTRRPTKDPDAALIRWFGDKPTVMRGVFVKLTEEFYTLRIDGVRLDFDRNYWEEIVE